MKYLRNMLLMLIMLTCWCGSSFGQFFVITSDQFGAPLSDVWSSGYTSYNGSSCQMGFVWEVPGVNTYPQFVPFLQTATQIWPPDWAAGCLNVPSAPCGGRYSFDRVTAGSWMFDAQYTNFMAKTFEPSWMAGYSRACAPGVLIQPGESAIYAQYNKNTKYGQNIVVDMVPQGQTLSAWTPVNFLVYYTPPNRETLNQFYYATYHTRPGLAETVAAPYGYLYDEISPNNPSEVYAPHYLAGNKITSTNNLPAPIKLPSARTGFTATLLQNGKIMVLGGRDDANSALYDLTRNSWSNVPTAFNSYYHTATLLPNGKVLVTGGAPVFTNAYQNAVASVRLFDPTTNGWSDAAPLSVPRMNHTATLLPNGKVLVAGGEFSTTKYKSVEIYDPATDSWSAGPDMPEARYGAAAILLPTNGKVLVSGGASSGGQNNEQRLAYLYTPATDSWSSTAFQLTSPRYGHSIALSGENVLLIGGTNQASMNTTERYYPPHNAFYGDGQGTMITGRYYTAAVTLPDGKVLIIGGSNGTPQDSVEIFEGMTNKTSQYNVQLAPTYTPAIRVAPFTGTKWIERGQTTLKANPVADLLDGRAFWRTTGWSGGTGRIPASGASDTVSLTTTYTDSAITWNYTKDLNTRILVDGSLPEWVKSAFAANYDFRKSTGSIKLAGKSEYWSIPGESSTIILPEKISQGSGSAEEIWLLDASATGLALPAWATLSYDSATREYRVQQINQSAGHVYNVVYKRHFSTKIIINSAMPAWVKDQFESRYNILGNSGSSIKTAATTEYLTLSGSSSTIVLPEKINRVVNNAEEVWALDATASGLALSTSGATLTYDSGNGEYRIQQDNLTFNWTYNVVYYKTNMSTKILVNGGMPQWVKDQFENLYDIRVTAGSIKLPATTEYWLVPGGSSTIIIPEKISQVVNNLEEIWVLDKSASGLALPGWAALLYDSAAHLYRIQQTSQTAGWDFNLVYNRISASVTGVDPAHITLLKNLPGYAPRLSATAPDNGLSDMHFSAPNMVYADDSGNYNTIRYVLTGWDGTGSIGSHNPLTPLTGASSIIDQEITQESTITWHYKKQIRVAVTTSGENEPLRVYELPGDTSAGSDTITNIATRGTESDGTPYSLIPNMTVFGHGIEEGTAIESVNYTNNTVKLTKTAKQTFVGSNGQRLTFSTTRAYGRAGDITENSVTVSNIDTTNLTVGLSVSGNGIEDSTTVTAITPSVTLSKNAFLTLTGADGERLTFGSADPRECKNGGDVSPTGCAALSGVNYYDFNVSIMPDTPPTLLSQLYLTIKNQFVETELDESGSPVLDGSGNPQTLTRTLKQVIPPEGAIQNPVDGRKVFNAFNITKPMTVQWRYNPTNAYPVGKPIMPPLGVVPNLDPEKAPTITITDPDVSIPGDTAANAFVLAWDTSSKEYKIKGDTASESDTITTISTSNMTVGMFVSGPGIAAGTMVVSFGPNSVRLDRPATSTATESELIFTTRQGNRYFPIHPVKAFTVKWPIKGSSAFYTELGTTIWLPKQKHIATAPANLQPPGAVNSYHSIPYTTNSAQALKAEFNVESAGISVIRFNTPKVLPDLVPGTAFIVVKTELKPAQLPEDEWPIGSKITNSGHHDPENKTGYAYYDGGVYDGAGENRAYDRATRSGTIIPVNESLPGDMNPLVVIWYEVGQGAIGWPITPIQYRAVWPGAPRSVMIGTGATVAANAMVYNQPYSNLPGFNPNEEHAMLEGETLYALRNDLNSVKNYSQPYVLLKYYDGTEWKMDVHQVVRPLGFSFTKEAGKPILPPLPNSMQAHPQSRIKLDEVTGAEVGGEYYLRDHKGGHWAKAAKRDGTSSFVMQWYYPMRSDFFWPVAVGYSAKNAGDPVPFLNNGSKSVPVDVTYVTTWPADAPILPVGDTLTKSRDGGLPDLYNFSTAEVVFDENIYNDKGPLVKLYAPERYLYAPLAAMPSGAKPGAGGDFIFPELPYTIQSRLFFDDVNKRLGFKGVWISAEGEESWLLPNLMTAKERDTMLAYNTNSAWATAVSALYGLARNQNNFNYPSGLIANPYKPSSQHNAAWWQNVWGATKLGLEFRTKDNSGNAITSRMAPARSVIGEKNALSAGMAQGEGYVVIAENNNIALGSAPVQLHVIKVSRSPVFQGVIKTIKSKNLFDEKLTLHYTGDFGGESEKFAFEWYYQPVAGSRPELPVAGVVPAAPWQKFNVTGNPAGTGLSDITIEGASPLTMSDNWFAVRYYYKNAWPESAVPPPIDDGKNYWSAWSGESKTGPALAMGWIKRVIDGLNPLEARVTNFRDNATSTTVNMIEQFGPRCEGPIAFNNDPEYLNSMGLICAYKTVGDRGATLSIDAGQDYGPTNDALLNINSRLATFYLALGNEAYADAVDPTIGFSTKSAEYGNMAPSVFAFQNQVDSLLEEELALMRGRDDSANSTREAPQYNRLIWNFTQGEGEVAYAQNYNVTDLDKSGVINAGDAKIMYPQGHGDAWGHYLQSISYYYKLLGHNYFSWQPRVEFVQVAGNAIMVDYLDERKFASIASARARVGSEILDATYKKFYTDDPAGQWQGYKDAATDRAWGVDEWARRAGQATLFDWVTANSILPDSSPAGDVIRKKYTEDQFGARQVEQIILTTDLQKIDRTKTPELKTIASYFHKMQSKMGEIDSGVNPLGLVKGVVPFDIDPAMVDMVGYGVDSKTHFEQIYARAEKALESAIVVYDYANGYTQRLRQNQDTLEEFKKNLTDQERDYKNRLIEIFGYPYADDIGGAKTYPDGYDGPDLLHYNYVDRTELTGHRNSSYKNFTTTYTMSTDLFSSLGGLGTFTETQRQVSYRVDTNSNWMAKPLEWTSKRRAPGRIQQALSELISAGAAYDKSLQLFESKVKDIENAKIDLEKRHGVLGSQITVRNDNENTMKEIDKSMAILHGIGLVLKRGGAIVREIGESAVETVPKEISVWGGDVMSPARGLIRVGTMLGAMALDIGGDVTDMSEYVLTSVKERKQAEADLKLVKSDANWEVYQSIRELQKMMADVDQQLLETYALKETIQQASGNYYSALAEGVRIMDEREEKRKQAAAEVQEYRFQDLGFRVFRNDAIQKYRAQMDLAAKYVYLAATAYDYETNLLGTASGAGRKFLSDIARQSSLGVISNGTPLAGFPGLADIMARLRQNFDVYKTQLGFNNPQTETTPFSLRTELFRIKGEATSNEDWRNVLNDHKVDDLWKIPEYRRYCRPFAPESAGVQPGIVIKFPTTVTYGKNFFGWPLSGGDSAYSTSNFATRIRTVGVWFQNYNNAGLSSTPRIYLVPTGADVLRSPTGDGFATREWQVKDQKMPIPFPIGDSDLKNPSFIPVNDSLSDELAAIRRVSDFRAYPYNEIDGFNPDQTTSDSRLIGRSVWNTEWMMIIPGSTLLFNKDVGLNTFINSVDDIKMFFQTYSYSGN